MTEEIADYDQQIKELISQIRESIQNELPNMKGKIRSEKIEYLTGRLNRLKQLMQSYKVELREISRVEAKPYEDKFKGHEKDVESLTAEFNAAKELSDSKRNVDEMTTGQMIMVAKEVQMESLQSVDRSKRIVEDTINVATETAQTLKSQTEQLERIDKQVDVVDSNLKKAEKQLRVFMRRMATDKLIMSFVCLVVLGILAVIVIAIVNKVSGIREA